MLTKDVYDMQLKKRKNLPFPSKKKVGFPGFTTLSNDALWHLE